MDAGRIRQSGAPLEVYRQPRSRFVAEFLGETNLLEGHAEGAAVSISSFIIHPSSSPPTGAVLLSIRPEAWRLGPRQEAVNSFPGRIVETVYLGEMARHRFALDAGRELIVFELNPRPRDGTALYATVDPSDVAIVQA